MKETPGAQVASSVSMHPFPPVQAPSGRVVTMVGQLAVDVQADEPLSATWQPKANIDACRNTKNRAREESGVTMTLSLRM